jgi:hypothetical protein
MGPDRCVGPIGKREARRSVTQTIRRSVARVRVGRRRISVGLCACCAVHHGLARTDRRIRTRAWHR